ncbi:hypothetical protein DVH24_000082 [Malus domestica]|uniref:Uncharacterized protein n=1 Tax=Malus domestica TaxID=3750 RepID=A0A498J3Q2_MALDO|nr:hypothetical protein DVH24_000082 [Malus domestica]
MKNTDDTVEAGLDVYKECNMTLVQSPHFEDVLCSPSNYVDEFLADPVEAGCANFTNLHSQPTDEAPWVSHNGFISCKESNTEVHDVTFGSRANKALMLSDQAEEDRPFCSIEMGEIAINPRDGKAEKELLRN